MSQPAQVILVLNGSFNPPHFLHLRLFEIAKDYCKEHGIAVLASIISPVSDHYSKENLLPFSTRFELCKAATVGTDIIVDDWEGKQETYTRTLVVLKHYYEHYNRKAIPFLVCGSDIVDSFISTGVWIKEQVIELLSNFGIFCTSRNANPSKWSESYIAPYLNSIKLLDQLVENNVSSTLIRVLLKKGKSVRFLLPDTEIEYIEKHKLYQD